VETIGLATKSVQARVIVKNLSLGHSQIFELIQDCNGFVFGQSFLTLDATKKTPLLDYQMCAYDGCRLHFRGPTVSIAEPYIAVLGGTETFGRFVKHPFPELIHEWTGLPVANFGVARAGLSLFSEEPWLLDAGSRSDLTVLQVLGAQNMSNRLYSVHSRRNDRFLRVSTALREMYPDVDFSQINFTGHLLETLAKDDLAFSSLVMELKWAWVQRMRRVISMLRGDVILLWISDRTPDEGGDSLTSCEPLFIDREMLDVLSDEVAGTVEIVTEKNPKKLNEMVIVDGEAEAALCLPGPQDHMRVAEAVAIEVAKIKGADPSTFWIRA